MKKNYVLDTNILIHNPDAINKFEDNDVWIPHPVVEELDSLKTEKGETGYAAREAIRLLAEYRQKGSLKDGVTLAGGGKLHVYVLSEAMIDLPAGWSSKKQDNIILFSACMLSKTQKNVILVTNDGNMQLKADTLGLPVQFYKNDRVQLSSVYKGRSEVTLSKDDMSKVKEGKMTISDFKMAGNKIDASNEFFIVRGTEGGSLLAKERNGIIVPINSKRGAFDLKPRNAGQFFLMDALMTSYEECPLTIVNGSAGTGKTLFALACGLEQVMDCKKYKRILVCRPNVTMDEEIGFLPGSEQDKISPLLRGCYDNLEVLLGNKDDDKESLNDKIAELFQRGYIQAQAIAYLRGRSITNTYIIIDEAQNATPNQILSIITRAGEGSKIVLMGDVNQIDAPRLDSQNNGLAYAIEKMKDSKLCQIVTFEEKECTRSALAKEASARLKK